MLTIFLSITVITLAFAWLFLEVDFLMVKLVDIREIVMFSKAPNSLPVVDFGEITIPELEANAEASMG